MMNALERVAEPQRLDALAEFTVLDTPEEPGFDSIVDLAATVCACPVALVSFVDRDRQWFKARVGFPKCETDLQSSVCAHALNEPDLLMISDLTLDPRTAANPLVTGDPKIRFYAGAPLRTEEGHTLGSLCVIDTTPRPGGLTEAQKSSLRSLASQVMTQLELRRALAERDELLEARRRADARHLASQETLRQSEAYWRGLFERLGEGFFVGEVERDPTGRVVDWRYIDVNRACAELIGRPAEKLRGLQLRQVYPNIEDVWVREFAAVVETGESVSFTRRAGPRDRWFEGRAFKLAPERFGVLFLEATERVRGETRRDALLELSERLSDLPSFSEMARAATDIVGRALGVERAVFTRLDETSQALAIEAEWTRNGAATRKGAEPVDAAWLAHVQSGKRFVVADGDVAPLADGENAARLLQPVGDRGRPAGALLIESPRVWTAEELIFLRHATDRMEAAIARLESEAQQQVLNQELSHRMKNLMAMIQAIARQTFREDPDQPAVQAFASRLDALAASNAVLLQQNWSEGRILDVTKAVLATFDAFERFDIDGPNFELGPKSTLSLSLMLHELTTNAVKYGSLSVPGGRVNLSWRVESRDEAELALDWREVNGPPATAPARVGFGSRLIRMGIAGTGGVTLHYLPTGFHAEVRTSLAQIRDY